MSNFYCAAPWRGLHINPRGDVKTCCAGDPNMLGNLNQHTIEEILISPTMQDIRTTIQSGKPHAYCYNCVKAERYGRSERDWHNDVNPDFDIATADALEHRPTLIDVRWNTTCNLSCNYCAESCSSKWADLKGIPVKSGARPYYEQVCDYLEQHQDSIREVALVGGEPLLLKENERLLDVIPKTATVTLITNLSVDLESNKIFKKLSNRKQVGWSLSFDNVGSRFEYVRHGAKWNKLLHNLDLIQDLIKNNGHWGGIHAVYNIYNATRLVEFTKFARNRGLSIQWQSLYQPEYLDPQQLGPTIIHQAKQERDLLLASVLCQPNEAEFFKNIQFSAGVEDLSPDLHQHIKEIESTYHTDQQGQFSHLWPELTAK
jgi:MoaA/NifB/PqqE/SkfB family radical SAM enzyme